MGIDLHAVIRHKMSKKEIIEFPKKIEEWHDIKEFVENARAYLEQPPDNPLPKTKWGAEITEDLLEKVCVRKRHAFFLLLLQ